ncbi:MAG: YybH family protein [Acidimicrobiia bacterium]
MTARTPEQIDPVWAEAFNNGDADAVVSLYEQGATFVLPSGEVISGVEAIRETLNGYLAMKPRIDLKTKKVLKAGDIVLVYSGWTLSATAEDGSAVDMAGDATVVARQQPDGIWRLVIDDPGWITT